MSPPAYVNQEQMYQRRISVSERDSTIQSKTRVRAGTSRHGQDTQLEMDGGISVSPFTTPSY